MIAKFFGFCLSKNMRFTANSKAALSSWSWVERKVCATTKSLKVSRRYPFDNHGCFASASNAVRLSMPIEYRKALGGPREKGPVYSLVNSGPWGGISG